MTSNTIEQDRYCIHQVTLMEQCDFQQSIECFAKHGIPQTAIWRDKVDAISDKDARSILNDNGVKPVALCPGILLAEDPREDLTVAMDANRKLLEQTSNLGADSLVVITGGLANSERDIDGARSRAEDSLAQLADYARDAGVRLAIEPLHPMICGLRSVISTLNEANDMLDRIDKDDVLGIVLDTYALWWQPGLKSQIVRSGNRIIHLHVSDWLQDTCDVRLDRGMPGDGVIDNQKIRSWVEAAGYTGPVEVEIFSRRNWWTKSADEVVQTIIDRYPLHL
ncbi:MAG: sugar phosphate isomerase/epimerase [Parasphingorhabdus sp.]|jgi:sugar phosphate isomerase/epimerase